MLLHSVMKNKDQVAQELAQWHFEVEPDLVRVVRVVGTNEDDPNEPIKLLEVNAATLSTGTVEPFGFTPTESVPFRTVIAILEARREVYESARTVNPRRWTGDIRKWSRPTIVTLNPERVIQATPHTRKQAAA